MENWYEKILEKVGEGTPISLETVISGEEGNIEEGLRRRLTPVSVKTDMHGRREAAVTAAYRNETIMASESAAVQNQTITVSEPVLPGERLIVLGGGHIAVPVCEFGARCGFSVIVCDDRPDFANSVRFPAADQIICDRFENAIRTLAVTPRDYVVIITRGHRHDADCLRTVLKGAFPAYLGMIGSRRRTRELLSLLEEEGFEREKLAKVCTPIGLNIGAVTPEELGICIIAEVIAYKRLPEHAGDGRYTCTSDVELPVLAYLARNRDPKAIVTVIETKGSSPRGAGAKMAVSPLGQVTGSIGGGCSEAAVTPAAVHIIGAVRYKIADIDLTGHVAESDGMVCGGTMRVLIEDGSAKAGI